METKLTAIGNSTGVRIPSEILAELGLKKGDKVYIVPTSEGFSVTPYDPEFAKDIELAKKFAKKYKNALHELAK